MARVSAHGFPKFDARDFPQEVERSISANDNFLFHPIEQREVVEPTPEEIETFATNNRFAIQALVKSLECAGAEHIVVEGAHVYAFQQPDDAHLAEARSTGMVSRVLSERGFRVTNVLFVDDYHDNDSVSEANDETVFELNHEEYADLCGKEGWKIDHLAFEAEMIEPADKIIEKLSNEGRTQGEGRGVILKSKKVHLKRPDNGAYACSVLDAGLSVLKFTQLGGHAIVNVTPRTVWDRSQQSNMRQIVREFLGTTKIPFYNFYTVNGDANIEAHDNPGAPHHFR